MISAWLKIQEYREGSRGGRGTSTRTPDPHSYEMCSSFLTTLYDLFFYYFHVVSFSKSVEVDLCFWKDLGGNDINENLQFKRY